MLTKGGKALQGDNENVVLAKSRKSLIDIYTYHAEWSKDDGVHVARCMEFPSIAAHGSTKRIALTEIKKVINASIKWLEEENKPIPEPHSELENDWKAARPAKRAANEQLVMSN